ncbi:hypothetical protein D3C81_1193380 [compost metagenome]
MGKLRDYLRKTDEVMEASGREWVSPRECEAFLLGGQVTPEPFSDHNLEWLIAECKKRAKYIRVEEMAGMAIFTFCDRSVLIVLETGEIYGVPVGSDKNVIKIEAWLREHGIVEREREALPAPFDSPTASY